MFVCSAEGRREFSAEEEGSDVAFAAVVGALLQTRHDALFRAAHCRTARYEQALS